MRPIARNVTVYAVDANGLRAKSSSGGTRKEIQEFADERMMQNVSGGERDASSQ